jgi:enoyl-CoA hydratase
VITQERHPQDERVRVVTIVRPERANALDAAHWTELADALNEANGDGARAIVLTGAGRSFCAGGDLHEPDYDALLKSCEDCMTALTSSPAPVIAYVNGPAIGAGLQLAVTCDLRVASPAAKFAIPAAAISRLVHPGVIRRMSALAGVGAATALLIGGETVTADRAYQLGLVDRIGEVDAALDWAGEIAGYAPLSLQFFKQELVAVAGKADGRGRYEESLQRLVASDDYAEAHRAHLEKRPPQFNGR